VEFDWEKPDITVVEAEVILEKAREAITYVNQKLPDAGRPDPLWSSLLSMAQVMMEPVCTVLTERITKGDK